MKRIEVTYDGANYTVSDTDVDTLKDRIATAVASGQPTWLTVNRGEGTARRADLLLTSTTQISIIGTHDT